VVALALTFPVWITVNVLGDPDNGVIVAGYVGSALMAGAYLAIGACFSALTRNQVIASILALVVCLLLSLSGFPLVLDLVSAWLPEAVVSTIASMSFLTHFQAIGQGVIDLRDIVFFVSILAFFLYANVLLVELNKSR